MSLHPDVMVLSEFFRGLDPAQGWPSDREDVRPDEFIEILSREDGVSPIYMAHGHTISETLIDVEEERNKHRGYISKPTISFIALRFLSDDPDALFDEIVEQVKTYPPQPLRDYFQRLIHWLLEKFDKPQWIERSGLSTNIFRHLREIFPDGKYVHIHRDGLETALSMRNHLSMAAYASYNADPPTEEELKRTVDLNIPTDENPLMCRIKHKLPVEVYADFWLHSLVMAYREFKYLRPEQLLEIRYEELVENPRVTLTRVAGFFELVEDEEWLDTAVKDIKMASPRASQLGEEEMQRLKKACWLGHILTGRDAGDSPADIASGKLVGYRHAFEKALNE